MQRKVIQQGPSTMMVSLPSTWIKENAVKKGDFIDLDLRGDEITLSITTDKGKKSCKINFSRKEDYFDRIIVKKYREGFDEIIVTYEDPTIMEKIRKTLKKLLGFEIIEQTQNSCTIGNLAKGSSEDYLQMVRRMFQITLALGESCLKLTKGNKQMIDAIQEMNETLIPLEQYNLRLIQLQKEFSPDKKISDFFLIWNIGLCGKKWASFAKDHLTKNNSYTKKEIEFFQEVVEYQNTIYDTYYDQKKETLHKIKEKETKLRKTGASCLETSKHKMIIFNLLRMIDRLHEITLYFEVLE